MKSYTQADIDRFIQLLTQLESRPEIQMLKEIPQHKGNTTFNHCHDVTMTSYSIARLLHISVNAERLIRSGMLHDYYLYDTETMPFSDYQHAIRHPKLAVRNVSRFIHLSQEEENAILSHMWPIPFSPLPRNREAWLICLADKICAFREMFLHHTDSSEENFLQAA